MKQNVKSWKTRVLLFTAILFTVVVILPFSLFVYSRSHDSKSATEISSTVDLNPLIPSDAEILGNWSGQHKSLVLSADNTFEYQTAERVVSGTWRRNDWNLYLKGNTDGCCNSMRFVTVHQQYFLLTDPPDFSEVEGHEWLKAAIGSALQR